MVGTWNTLCPDGNKSVKKNRPIIQNNMTYIENNLDLDHFFDDSSTTDGYHRRMSMVNLAADPTSLPGSTNGMFYTRQKTTTEAPFVQLPEPFFYHTPDAGVTNYYQQLGIRAMVLWQPNQSSSSSDPLQTDIFYSHNIKDQASFGVDKTSSSGNYTINFLNKLPSANYLVLGGVMGSNETLNLSIVIRGNSTISMSKDREWVKVRVFNGSSATNSFKLAWIVVLGG